MFQFLIASALCLSLVSQDDAPPRIERPSSTQQAPSSAPEDLTRLDIEELIRRLPAAGCEWRWDNARGEVVTDPAAEEMARRITAGAKLSDDLWRVALLSTGAVRFHPKWPKDEDYCISLAVPRWLGIAQIRLDPRSHEMRATTVGELFVGLSGTGAMIDARDARLGRRLGKAAAVTTEITFDVEVERRESLLADPDDPPPGMLWKGTITVPGELVDGFNQMAQPVDNEVVAEAVRDAVGAGFRRWGQDQRRVPFVVIDPDCAKYPMLETTGLDIKVEVLDGDEIIAESWLLAGDFDALALSSSIQTGKKRFYGSANLNVQDNNVNPANWVLRLSGQTDHIWLLWHAEQRWSGTITIPWAQAVEHERERTAVTGRGPEVSTPYWK